MGDSKTIKARVYRCPKCGADITWACHGQKGWASCTNSITATRVFTLDDIDTLIACDWQGRVERRPDGKVEIYYYAPI